MTEALQSVVLERSRQQLPKSAGGEGWTAHHDDTHSRGELARAAAWYALAAVPNLRHRDLWPWDSCWKKPTDERRSLVRATALLLAEIERIDRRDAAQEPRP